MTTRERLHAVFNFQPVDRLPLLEWAVWWDKTTARWRHEGAPTEERYALYDYFELEQYRQLTAMPFAPSLAAHAPAECGEGVAWIAGAEDYRRRLPHCYPRALSDEVTESIVRWKPAHERGEMAIWLTIWGYFGWPRYLFGIMPHFLAFYDNPELMQQMNEALCAHHLAMITGFFFDCFANMPRWQPAHHDNARNALLLPRNTMIEK